MEHRDLDAPDDVDFSQAIYFPSLQVLSILVTALSHPAKKLLSIQLYCQKKHFHSGGKSVERKKKKQEIFREKERETGHSSKTDMGLQSKLRGKGSVHRNRTRVHLWAVGNLWKGLRGAPARPRLRRT